MKQQTKQQQAPVAVEPKGVNRYRLTGQTYTQETEWFQFTGAKYRLKRRTIANR